MKNETIEKLLIDACKVEDNPKDELIKVYKEHYSNIADPVIPLISVLGYIIEEYCKVRLIDFIVNIAPTDRQGYDFYNTCLDALINIIRYTENDKFKRG